MEILGHEVDELARHRGQVFPLSERPADRDRWQVADEYGFDGPHLLKVVGVNGGYNGLPEIELDEDPRGVEIVEYNFRLQLDTALERRLLDCVVMGRAAGESDITDTCYLLQLQPLVFGERIRPGDQQE